jgi:HAD superfamily hydrolase (TIGR01509 family)
MTIQAVIFDMDGLLLDTEKAYLESFIETRRAFSLSDSPETFLKCVGRQGDEPNQIIRDSLPDAIELDLFCQEWEQRMARQIEDHVPLKPGAAQLVDILASKGVPMGVATSTRTEKASSRLDRSGLLKHFQCVIGGDLVARHKPDPEVYLKAMAHLGVPANNCIAFEDSEPGTRAAYASGALTVQVPDLIEPSEELRKQGHIIAPNLLAGAIQTGLIEASDI